MYKTPFGYVSTTVNCIELKNRDDRMQTNKQTVASQMAESYSVLTLSCAKDFDLAFKRAVGLTCVHK